MNKLLQRANSAISRLAEALKLPIVIVYHDDDKMLEIDGWIYVSVEQRVVGIMPSSHLIIECASYTPATRSQPEDVDVNDVEVTSSPLAAASTVVRMVLDQIMDGVMESIAIQWDLEDDRETV